MGNISRGIKTLRKNQHSNGNEECFCWAQQQTTVRKESINLKRGQQKRPKLKCKQKQKLNRLRKESINLKRGQQKLPKLKCKQKTKIK